VRNRATQAQAAYDAIAEPYTDTFFDELDRKPFDRALIDAFARTVAPGPALDVGSGPGHVARYLTGAGVETVALDISHAMLRIAHRRPPPVDAVQASMTALPVRPGSLAGIAAFYSIIHLDRSALTATFADWHRALRGHGRVLVSFHGGVGELDRDELEGRSVELTFTMLEPDEVSGALDGAGFAVDEVRVRDPYDFEAQTRRGYVSAYAAPSRRPSAE